MGVAKYEWCFDIRRLRADLGKIGRDGRSDGSSGADEL